jgi:hypothetical protein
VLRVIQWTTGNVGRRALRAIAAHPQLELVGCFAHSTEKVGRDAGELCGLPPLGVIATDDVDALLALGADCVSYMPVYPDVDEIVRILEAGANIVTTSAFITGHSLGAATMDRIDAAARRGGVSIYGSGVNPGHANVFALVTAGICDRVDRISVLESVDASGYASAETMEGVGFGHPVDEPGLADRAREGSAVFADAVALMADALAVDLTDVRYDVEFARALHDLDLGFMKIPEGCVAGLNGCWTGLVDERAVIELRVIWKMGEGMEPEWPLRHGYFIEVDGEPKVRSRFQIMPPDDWDEPSFDGLGMIMTAMPAVNAIPPVCAAPPGIVRATDVPVVTAAHFFGRSEPL